MIKQAGFTLIELVVVLVLLGILGAVATARFQDLSTDAADAAEQGVAAEISAGGAINYAVQASGGTPDFTYTTGTESCATYADNSMQSGSVPTDITVSGTVDCTGGGGTTGTCTVTHSSGSATNATATLYCTD